MSDPQAANPSMSAPESCLRWIRAQEMSTGGIRVHSQHARAYPEVTGYLIPTLLQYGERDLAERFTRWLIDSQRPDGGFNGSDGKPYVFDTGQALRGLLAGSALWPEALDTARRAADYLLGKMQDGGSGGFGERYGGEIPEAVHLYVLPPLVELSRRVDRPEYRRAAERCLDHYCGSDDLLRIGDLTHFLAYELEALIDLGRPAPAAAVLEALRGEQAPDGALRGREGARWVCTPGLAQTAICWYRLGQAKPADRALKWLDAHQQPSGGFLGSYGEDGTYFPAVELSWAAKFYLDAHRLRVLSFFERNEEIFPDTVAPDDGRTQLLAEVVQPGDRVLDVGCGKGRFLKAIRELRPGTTCAGVDISPALLRHVPEGIAALPGSLEAIPCADDGFDVVFSVEAIEHSPNPEAAVAEMVRVTRPGGCIVIIDKHRGQWGRLECPSWERWPETTELQRRLELECEKVTVRPVGYNGRSPSDGLMVAWIGQKRLRQR